MFSKLPILSFIFFFSLFFKVEAQDCYQKAIEKGKKFQYRGEKDKACKAWSKAKDCPDADMLELARLEQSLDDFDLDGIPDAVDGCRKTYGAKSRNGCPCAEIYRQKGVDHYFDGQLDSARFYNGLAKTCDDAPGLNSMKDFDLMIASNSVPYPNEVDKKVFTENEVDKKPEFPQGEKGMFMHLYSTISYPPLARENGVDGIALIEFIVEKDGSLTHFRIREDIRYGIGEESLRVAKTLPKFIPGVKNGQSVRVLYILPVKFKLA